LISAPAARLRGLASILVLLCATSPWLPAGGAEGRPIAPEPDVCVLTPRVEPDGDGLARALVPVSRPTIFVRNPLVRMRILSGGALIWRLEANASAPIEGPIYWPLPPLRAGERLTLQLQPVGADLGAFASIELQADADAVLIRNDRLLAGLGDEPARWRTAVERASEQKDLALTSAILFAFEGPSGDELNALRLLVIERSCGGAPPP
jgi:hypothetical protein